MDVYTPGDEPGTVRSPTGELLRPPADWELLPPGDAALTRRVKAAGPHWTVQQRRGRRTFSQGIWAPAATIADLRAALDEERASPTYQRRRTADARRREATQTAYVEDFTAAVRQFLAFAPCYAELAERLAAAVAAHATPVGSGTVARTARIPLERRAAAAVIAWLRHQTTGYDQMRIARVRGKRREVRRMLAQRSQELLDRYRRGAAIDADCPLWRALQALAEGRDATL